MQLEEMDGMFAAYVPTDDKVIALLKSSSSVSVSDPTGTWRTQPVHAGGIFEGHRGAARHLRLRC